MTADETAGYLTPPPHASPAAPTPCSPTTPSPPIHQSSRGYPRAVNNLAIQALIAAYADGKAIVDESAARAAITEVTTE